MPSSAQLPTQGERPSTGDDTPGPWLYNRQARIVTHAANSCNPCSAWAIHRASALVINDVPLDEATEQQNDAICAPLAAEVATLRSLRDSLRREIDNAGSETTRLRDDLKDANNEIFRQRDELEGVKNSADRTIVRLRDQVTDLENKVHEFECGNTPRRRKVPRRDSRSPSRSRSRHASSRASHPVSPMREERYEITGTFAHVYKPRLPLVEVQGSMLPTVYLNSTCLLHRLPHLHTHAGVVSVCDYVMWMGSRDI